MELYIYTVYTTVEHSREREYVLEHSDWYSARGYFSVANIRVKKIGLTHWTETSRQSEQWERHAFQIIL